MATPTRVGTITLRSGIGAGSWPCSSSKDRARVQLLPSDEHSLESHRTSSPTLSPTNRWPATSDSPIASIGRATTTRTSLNTDNSTDNKPLTGSLRRRGNNPDLRSLTLRPLYTPSQPLLAPTRPLFPTFPATFNPLSTHLHPHLSPMPYPTST
ncbi:hypothetical protein CROQUDRAFT_95589 [Cronartium quercuum f. sp. fusiforme G11]|uniref:Uncharacterized protein n=1 Tax=Cronartium quercuum f. sp. fusiforme G11 TaxID=708437 RepID=A0A9P6NGX5_9BASI|nr:hypothetical protein CROQUDRAFT_95589 [Cronartium quercuum f. sp. fusiforme G11]